jgi:hypothetical protein
MGVGLGVNFEEKIGQRWGTGGRPLTDGHVGKLEWRGSSPQGCTAVSARCRGEQGLPFSISAGASDAWALPPRRCRGQSGHPHGEPAHSTGVQHAGHGKPTTWDAEVENAARGVHRSPAYRQERRRFPHVTPTDILARKKMRWIEAGLAQSGRT